MKVLLDACVWGGAAVALRNAGHDVETVAAWSADPGDEEILSRALEASQTIITLDKASESLRSSASYRITGSSGLLPSARKDRALLRLKSSESMVLTSRPARS